MSPRPSSPNGVSRKARLISKRHSIDSMATSISVDLDSRYPSPIVNIMTKAKSKKKPMTLDDFAAAIQTDLARMVTKDDLKSMATKDDLHALDQKMVTREEFRELRNDVKMITDTMISKADLAS